jgi:hypothetical protein
MYFKAYLQTQTASLLDIMEKSKNTSTSLEIDPKDEPNV